MAYTQTKLAKILNGADITESNLPKNFDINNIEAETINYFLASMHKTLAEEYLNEPTTKAIDNCFSKLDKSYLDKPKGYSRIFLSHCYDKALAKFRQMLNN